MQTELSTEVWDPELPTEVWDLIFKYIPHSQLPFVKRTCKRFHQMLFYIEVKKRRDDLWTIISNLPFVETLLSDVKKSGNVVIISNLRTHLTTIRIQAKKSRIANLSISADEFLMTVSTKTSFTEMKRSMKVPFPIVITTISGSHKTIKTIEPTSTTTQFFSKDCFIGTEMIRKANFITMDENGNVIGL